MEIEGISQQTSKPCRTFWGFLCITKIKELLCLKIIKITWNGWHNKLSHNRIINTNQTMKVNHELNQTQNNRFWTIKVRMKQISLEWTLLELAQSCPGKAWVFNHPLIAHVRDLTWAHVGALLFSCCLFLLSQTWTLTIKVNNNWVVLFQELRNEDKTHDIKSATSPRTNYFIYFNDKNNNYYYKPTVWRELV